jgi:hypothetical protein
MSEFDDDYEDEDQMAEHKAETIDRKAPEVRIEGLTVDALNDVIEGVIERNYRLSERAKEAVDKAVESAVEEALAERLATLAEEALRPLIAEKLANGWPTFDTYGKQTGTKSFPEMLREALFQSRNYSNENLCHLIFKTELEKALKGEFGAALTEARNKVRAMLDDEVMGRFRKAMKDGLGMKD